LPGKLAALVGLIVVSRVGVYVRIPGVDVGAFSAAMQSNGLLGYVDALSGGSISKVGVMPGWLSANGGASLLRVVVPCWCLHGLLHCSHVERCCWAGRLMMVVCGQGSSHHLHTRHPAHLPATCP
jgi:hypothetical protein